MRNNVLLGV